jgi:hypothetical protein
MYKDAARDRMTMNEDMKLESEPSGADPNPYVHCMQITTQIYCVLSDSRMDTVTEAHGIIDSASWRLRHGRDIPPILSRAVLPQLW